MIKTFTFTLCPAKYLLVHSITNCLYFYLFSELKRRLKAEQKAKEKLEKESAATVQKKQPKKESSVPDATKSADISPNVKLGMT